MKRLIRKILSTVSRVNVNLSKEDSALTLAVRLTLAVLLTVATLLLEAQLAPDASNYMFFIWFPLLSFVAHFLGFLPALAALFVCSLAAFQIIPFIRIPTTFDPFILFAFIFLACGLIVVIEHRRLLTQRLTKELQERKATVKELESIRQIVESTNDLVFLVSTSGKILYANSAARVRLEISDKKLSEVPWEEIHPFTHTSSSSDMTSLGSQLTDIWKSEAVSTYLLNQRTLTSVPVSLGAFPVQLVASKEPTFALVARDLSRELELHQHFEAARGHLSTAFLSYDFLTHKFTSSSDLESLTEAPAKISSWAEFIQLIYPEDRASVAESLSKWEAVDGDQAFDIQFRILKGGDAIHWLDAKGIIYRDRRGRSVKLEGLIVDITPIKESESKLIEALRLRDHFFAIASHELKTPITSLNLQLEVLRQTLTTYLKNNPEGLSESIDVLNECSEQYERLTNLINDFLDVTRIANGKLQLSKELISVGELVASTGRLFPASAQIKTVVNCDEIWALADQERLRQVIINLVSNAIKFGDGKPIEVSCSEDQNDFRIEVADQGPGIPHEEQQKIFNLFKQAAGDKAYRGLGLGLFIVREIVRAHGGHVKVESEPGCGSRFIVCIPKGATGQVVDFADTRPMVEKV